MKYFSSVYLGVPLEGVLKRILGGLGGLGG